MTATVDQVWPFVVGIAIVVAIVVLLLRLAKASAARISRSRGEMGERMEAMFRASFPELQPHFHPARVHQYAKARIARKAPSGPTSWKNPPGFPAAAAAEIELDGMRDKVRLVDAAGAKLAEFIYEEHPEGGVLRVGKGKFTVNVKGPEPRVRYWHPEREFKWTPASWRMNTAIADQTLASRDTSTSSLGDSGSSSSSSSSSSARAAATGAAAGAIIAAGGTFDGGGASAAWDESGGGAGGSEGSASGAGDSDFGSGASDSQSGSGASDSDSGSGSGDSSSSSTSY